VGVPLRRGGPAGGRARPGIQEREGVRTHWDMLLERRSIPELEELLKERLALLRASRGEKPRRKRTA